MKRRGSRMSMRISIGLSLMFVAVLTHGLVYAAITLDFGLTPASTYAGFFAQVVSAIWSGWNRVHGWEPSSHLDQFFSFFLCGRTGCAANRIRRVPVRLPAKDRWAVVETTRDRVSFHHAIARDLAPRFLGFRTKRAASRVRPCGVGAPSHDRQCESGFAILRAT